MPISILAAAVVALGLVIAAMFGRYEIDANAQVGQMQVIARIDRLTGNVEFCVPLLTFDDKLENDLKQPGWCKRPALR